MGRLAAVILVVLGLCSGCTFSSELGGRTLLSVSADLPLDEIRVLVATGDEIVAERLVSVEVTRDLNESPLGVALDALPEPTLGLSFDLQVTGARQGAVRALYHGPLTLEDGGVMPLHLIALSTACDQDADGAPDCAEPGCCDGVPDLFSDCAPEASAQHPGAQELCNALDDDCDGEIDEGVCPEGADTLFDRLEDTPLRPSTDASDPDTGPIPELTPSDATEAEVSPEVDGLTRDDVSSDTDALPDDADVESAEDAEVIPAPLDTLDAGEILEDISGDDAIEDAVLDDAEVMGEDAEGDADAEMDVEIVACVPACDGALCGPDGCGGTCGECAPGTGCVDGICEAAIMGADCAAVHAAEPDWPDGVYLIDPDATGVQMPFEVYCDMSTDGGGWTLIAVSSDDAQNTWTWQSRALMGNAKGTVGSLDERHKDFKSAAYNQLVFTSVLFVHSTPSDPEQPIWARYDPGDGTENFGAFIAGVGENVNYSEAPGFPMIAGSLVDPNPEGLGAGAGIKELCSTDLYINPCGLDGEVICTGSKNAYGPTWSLSNGEGCPLDDPGFRGGLGPCSGSASNHEYSDDQPAGVGFGIVLGLNTGEAGTGANHMSVYIR